MSSKPFFFTESLFNVADRLRANYSDARPYPHCYIDQFLPLEVANGVARDFPDPSFPKFRHSDNPFQRGKLGSLQASYFAGLSPSIRHLLNEFNGMVFLDFLERLTGLTGLIPDPHFRGGALHQVYSGGSLDIHADFNFDETRQLERRVNVLLYLNREWKPEYGGDLELWDSEMTNCEVKLSPIFNRIVIFNTSSVSYHGHPNPLQCPWGITRNSLALYYYSRPTPSLQKHSTLWQARPSRRTRALKEIIYLICPPIFVRLLFWLRGDAR